MNLVIVGHINADNQIFARLNRRAFNVAAPTLFFARFKKKKFFEPLRR
jgi:hypothetical protein